MLVNLVISWKAGRILVYSKRALALNLGFLQLNLKAMERLNMFSWPKNKTCHTYCLQSTGGQQSFYRQYIQYVCTEGLRGVCWQSAWLQ